MAALAWLGWQDLWSHGGGRPLAWADVSARTLGAPETSQLQGFGDPRRLRSALGPSATLPAIDFARDEAVLIAAGPRSSTAYALDVVRVIEERRRIVIQIRERTPSLRRPGAATLAFPFRLITFRRSGKPIELEWKGRP